MSEPAASEDRAILEGYITIQAALETGSRAIEAIYIDRTRQDKHGHLARLAHRAADLGVRVERVPPDVIAAQVSGQTHGGVIALAGPRHYVTLDDLLGKDVSPYDSGRDVLQYVPTGHAPFIAMIDGVEDPFNFGQAVRALYAAGADGLVVRPRNWMSAAGIVGRASAGASERIPTAVAETAEEAARFFRARGLTAATTARDRRAVPLYEADLTVPLFVLIGGEKRGVTRSFLDKADVVLAIPYGRQFGQSLGTTAAAAVLAFEVMRQRSSKSMFGLRGG